MKSYQPYDPYRIYLKLFQAQLGITLFIFKLALLWFELNAVITKG